MDKKSNQPSEAIEEQVKILVDFLSESKPENELPITDGILAFGHCDSRPALQAAKLWKKGKAPIVIISGKGRDKIPAGFESEADFYVSIMDKERIPRSAMILEKESTNTLENVIFSMRVCSAKGINPKSLILCVWPYLLRRSRLTFKKHFPDVVVYGSTFVMPTKELLMPTCLHRILGEIDRLRDYAVKGDIAPVSIPEPVSSAIRNIKEALPNL